MRPIDLVDDQAVGSPTSTQDRLHLRGRLDARAEGFRAGSSLEPGGPGAAVSVASVPRQTVPQGRATTPTTQRYYTRPPLTPCQVPGAPRCVDHLPPLHLGHQAPPPNQAFRAVSQYDQTR